MEKALAYALEKRERFLADLIELLKIQSVSADPQRDAEVRRSAQWTADFWRKSAWITPRSWKLGAIRCLCRLVACAW